MNGDAFSLDAHDAGPDDQARTLRIMVSSSRRARLAGIVREIEAREADKERRETRVLSAFLTKRPSGPADIWTAPHRLVVVAGGRPGAGATTLARNLASEVSIRGIRAEYVAHGVGRAIEPGGADYYLVDSEGSGDFVGLADYLVLVAAPDAEAVRGAYSALKRFRTSDPDLPAGLVVNCVASPGEGAALAERIASAARALLGGPGVEVLGWVLEDAEVRSESRDAAPFIVRSPRSAAAAGVRLCARRLSAGWRKASAA